MRSRKKTFERSEFLKNTSKIPPIEGRKKFHMFEGFERIFRSLVKQSVYTLRWIASFQKGLTVLESHFLIPS